METSPSNRAEQDQLTIEIRPQPDSIIVLLRGSADIHGVEQLDRKLTVILAQRPAHLILDLSQLVMISSICMGTLLRTKHAVERTGGRMSITGAHGFVLDALERARLTTLFQLNSADAEARPGDVPG